ncbi:hypothetical protein BC332_33859 [Capsicum chinense]|nr:hypothetical protein BC332_33859 [Capsicum chinense]
MVQEQEQLNPINSGHNDRVGEYVEREKRISKANPYYKNLEFLLEKDRLPSEINRKLKPNVGGKKARDVSNHGLAFDDNYRKQLYRSLLGKLLRTNFGNKGRYVGRKFVENVGGDGGGTDFGNDGRDSGRRDVGNEGSMVVGRRIDGGGTEVENDIVRQLITRVDDRVRISLSGGDVNFEKIKEIRRTLEGELSQVRSYVKRIKDMEQE